jgi:hypothetical protein
MLPGDTMTALPFVFPPTARTWPTPLFCENVHFMRYLSLFAAVVIGSIIPASADPAPQNSTFHTNANLSVDNTALTLSSAVAITEARKYPAGYSWLRIHFYPFPLTSGDLGGNGSPRRSTTPFDHKVHTNSYGVMQLVDKDSKSGRWICPGHACTIAPFERMFNPFADISL